MAKPPSDADAHALAVFAQFDRLLELEPALLKVELDALTEDDPAVASEVAALLGAADAAGDFLELAALEVAPTLVAEALASSENPDPGGDPSLEAGALVGGAWRLIRPLGTGGMGEVWEVSRADDQFEQRAALKLLRRGFETAELVRRFRAERQILARLRHPAIAHLYDGGLTGDARPYFVMELVDGEPLTPACARRGLSVDARLRIFLGVCDAVDAAHRSLIVHRDLKPSNVLLTESGEVKLLDFGIAKLLGDDDPDAGQTRGWERPMTPAYAAPEQILGDPVSTTTDVYALGVMLFELLTGKLPHRRSGVASAQLVEQVRRETAERPSHALRQGGEEATAIERLEPSERLHRARRLQGDLDWIVLRALAREPERRYPSAAALAADLRRHLSGQPVEAGPDSLAYRTGKFVRRHRAGVAAAGLVTLALLAGLGAALWQARVARLEASRARAETIKAHRISDFLKGMILEAHPLARPSAEPLTLLEVVQNGAQTVAKSLADAPELQAQMMIFFGDLAIGLNDLEQAAELIEGAHRIATTTPSVGELVVVDALGSLGQLRTEQRRLEEAEGLFVTALARLAARTEGSADAEAALRLESTINSLFTQLLLDRDRTGEAIVRMERSIEILRVLGHGEDLQRAMLLYNLGLLQNRAGRLEPAEARLRESLELHRALLPDSDLRLHYPMSGLASVRLARGGLDEAHALHEEALAVARSGLGEQHPLVASALCNLAETRREQGRLGEARAGFEAGIAVASNLGALRQEQLCRRQLAECSMLEVPGLGDSTLEDALARARNDVGLARQAAAAFLGEDGPATLLIDARLAWLDALGGDPDGASRTLEELVERLAPETLAADRALALQLLGGALALAGRREEAISRLRGALEIATSELGSERVLTARIALDLGLALADGVGAERVEALRRIADAVAQLDRLGRGWLPDAGRGRSILRAADSQG